MAFLEPNYTQIPNQLLDEMLPDLGMAELKVLLVISRKTFGWHKQRDRITLSCLEKKTGLTRANVCRATKSLEDRGYIEKHTIGVNGEQKVYYSIIFKQDSNNYDQYHNNTRDQYHKDTPPSIIKIPSKETKETKENSSSKRKAPKGAPAVASCFEDEIRNSKIPPEDQQEAIDYYYAYKDTVEAKENPVGWVIKMWEVGRVATEIKRAERAKKRKKWGETHEWSSNAGYSEACEDGYLVVTGSRQEFHKWDSDDTFWANHGL